MMMGETVKNLVEDFNRKIGGVQETLGKTKKTLYDEIDARLKYPRRYKRCRISSETPLTNNRRQSSLSKVR